MEGVTDRSPRSRWRTALLPIAAGASVIALLTPVFLRKGLPWYEALVASANIVVPALILGWLVWRRLMHRDAASSRSPGLAGHVLLAFAFSTAWTLAIVVLGYPIDGPAAIEFLRTDAVWQFLYGFVVYALIATAAQAVRARRQLRERELAAASAELQALRAQLDPHFLFNTLHSLTQLAREDPGATQDALERFGELMRYVLYAGRDASTDVALEDELTFVRHYLALERLRLGDRLRVVEDIDPDALELAVPPLLLQPLTENAVRHGLSPRRAGGTIRLSARVHDDRLAIEVADDGNGAEPDAWRESSRLGLKVVRRQIEARFPGSGRFDVRTEPGAGFCVRLDLPARIPNRAA
jgi:signal transduction histidine kinase